MTSSEIVLILAVFGASSVEMVEALTIVAAAGTTRGWRPALYGTGTAMVVLAAVVGALGPALVYVVPLNALRIVIGALLLILGLQWLRKAILRASGRKAKHDEDAIYAKQVAELSGQARTGQKIDRLGFVVAFKGVFLEGLEVIIIVLTLGTASHRLSLAVVSAAAAVLIIGTIGAIVAKQLANVPENAMKIGVALMLVSFGSFWTGEGMGVHWPGSDLAIPVLIGVYGVVTWAAVRSMTSRAPEVAVHAE